MFVQYSERIVVSCEIIRCTPAYFAAGGFDESLTWSEEVAFANSFKRQGRFVLLRECVSISGLKVRAYSAWELLQVAVRLARGRQARLDYWYGPRRDRRPSPNPARHSTVAKRSELRQSCCSRAGSSTTPGSFLQ